MRQMVVCAAVLFVLSVIPLLWLGKYNVMCIDDYDYGRGVHDTWVATESVRQVVETAVEQTKKLFMDQQGTYVSCFLMALCPMNFRYDIAFVVPIIMIGMLAVSSFFFGRQILTRWLGSDRFRASFVMFLLLFLFYQVMEAPFEGIYWYNGATHYVLMESLLFIMLTLVSESIWTEKKRGAIGRCVLASVGGVIVGGGNLVTGLQAEIVLLFLFIFTFVTNRKKVVYALFPILTFTAGFLCNVMAPGNSVKASMVTEKGYFPVLAILLSFYYGIMFVIKWTSALVILVWLALLPALWQIGKKSEKSFCILSAMFTPTLYALGTAGLSRVDNIIQMVYYLCLFFVTAYWLGWCSHREDVSKQVNDDKNGGQKIFAGKQLGIFLESTGNVMTVSCLLVVLAVWILTADKNTYTGVSALRSLVKGEAQTYYAEAMERHALYEDETVTDVVVASFSVKPALFAFEDLTEDENNWLNLAVAAYYHKDSVKRK